MVGSQAMWSAQVHIYVQKPETSKQQLSWLKACTGINSLPHMTHPSPSTFIYRCRMGTRGNLVGGIGRTNFVGINGGDSCHNRRRRGEGGEQATTVTETAKRHQSLSWRLLLIMAAAAPGSTAFANTDRKGTTTTITNILGLGRSGRLNYHGSPRPQRGSRHTKHIPPLSSSHFPTLMYYRTRKA